jgi:hypothetical protein
MKVKLNLSGVSPLIPQSDRLVNPLDPLTKEIKSLTGKRKKTDDDHYQIAKLEWIGALYFDPSIGPFIPTVNIAGSIRDGAKFSKLGSTVERALVMDPNPAPILYRGPRDLDGLWADESYRFSKSVVVNAGSRTMRCRPIFGQWALECEGQLQEDVLDPDVFERVARDAGQLVGLGGYRRGGYGRYECSIESA